MRFSISGITDQDHAGVDLVEDGPQLFQTVHLFTGLTEFKRLDVGWVDGWRIAQRASWSV